MKKTHTIFNKGFTILELLIIIAIIGILSALIMANAVGVRQRANDGKRKSDIKQIQSALEFYRADEVSYPGHESGTPPYLKINCPSGTQTYFGNTTCTVTYLQKIPKDPKTGANYFYSGSATNYILSACLENINDAEGTTTAPTVPVGSSYSCPAGTVYYIVTNP